MIRQIASFGLAAGLLAGCGRNDVKTYRVSGDDNSPAPAQNSTAPAQLHWTLPQGWQEAAPGQMRVASFSIAGADGKTADVGVIPLPANGQETSFVNMWREQMQLPATTNIVAETVAIGAGQGKLFDIASEALLIDGKYRGHILVAMLTRGETSWFFKMTGEDSLVAAQKPAFLQFLKSVGFDPSNAPTPTATTVPPDDSLPRWEIPAGWQAAPLTQFLIAKYAVAGDNGAQAAVNVISLAGDGGGLAANANRWRGQLGLAPVAEILTTSFDTPNGKATMVDYTRADAKNGPPARLVGVLVPVGGQTWFYKLMGDEAVVAAQKDAFVKFIQSAKYPDAR